jgi:hypothetical protein
MSGNALKMDNDLPKSILCDLKWDEHMRPYIENTENQNWTFMATGQAKHSTGLWVIGSDAGFGQ